MFGYIRPLKPQMKICEYDIYRAVYCGLCKELADFGLTSRFTLSYDFTFLALMGLAVNNEEFSVKQETCMAHMIKKAPCLQHCRSLNYTASAACISVYHKLLDDKSDRQTKKKLAASGILPSMKKAYKKASALYPELAECVEENMILQRKLEDESCSSIDRAAEPTATIMGKMAEGLSEDSSTKRVLFRMGYLLGRFVYITDALDDVEDDFKNHDYNPFLQQNVCDEYNLEIIREFAESSINLTLGELANAYVLLDASRFRPILENIIYLGLRNTFDAVMRGEKVTGVKGHKPQ